MAAGDSPFVRALYFGNGASFNLAAVSALDFGGSDGIIWFGFTNIWHTDHVGQTKVVLFIWSPPGGHNHAFFLGGRFYLEFDRKFVGRWRKTELMVVFR